jgi:hypothetical protein
MADLIPPQKIAGLTPYVCEYQGPDGAYDITLYGSDPAQIITDHGDSLPGLKVVGILEGTIDSAADRKPRSTLRLPPSAKGESDA